MMMTSASVGRAEEREGRGANDFPIQRQQSDDRATTERQQSDDRATTERRRATTEFHVGEFFFDRGIEDEGRGGRQPIQNIRVPFHVDLNGKMGMERNACG